MIIEDYPDFEPEGFSDEIFQLRYAFLPDESWFEACHRVARQVAVAEVPAKRYYQDQFESILKKNLFCPGGRIWAGSGKTKPSLINCFVINDELDSKEGWGRCASEMIIATMAGGGVGIDFSDVRPAGSSIAGNGGVCPGPVALMNLIDGCAEPVRSGGQRRAALMFSLDLSHPDIETFLDAKLTQGALTHANISTKCRNTSDFITAVRADLLYTLSWKGRLGGEVSARHLWRNIVQNAYQCAEPGFLNWELIENESTVSYLYPLVTTNPCGEQPLPSYGSCCLGHLVLPRFVGANGVDYETLADCIRLGVRFLDNVLTVNQWPLREFAERSAAERRIGLGVTGLADMLILLGLKYGSEDGNKFIDRLFKFIAKTAYEASVMLAIEKGPFPLCERKKHADCGFVRRQSPRIRSLVREHGIRNCAVLTVAPTGTISILSGNCSSGIEPIFAPAYERRFWSGGERKTEIVFHPLFSQTGLARSTFISAYQLSPREHFEVQKIVQRHVDSAVSKTINLPADYPIDELSDLWLEYLPFLKGCTFYREGSRGYIRADGTDDGPPLVALTVEEALARLSESGTVGQIDSSCPKGVCEL